MNHFDVRLQAYLQQVRGLIAEHGIAVQGVFPRAGDAGLPFAYTIGLTALTVLQQQDNPVAGLPGAAHTAGLAGRRHPELVIVGNLAPETAQGILNHVAGDIIAGRLHPAPGDRLPGYLSGGLALMVAGPAGAGGGQFTLGIARAIYGPVPPPLQLVWPDRAGRYPWHPGYDTGSEQRNIQPVLGPVPGANRGGGGR